MDSEALAIMKDGGLKLCDEALSKWMSPSYYKGLEDLVPERKKYWSDMKGRIRKLYKEIEDG